MSKLLKPIENYSMQHNSHQHKPFFFLQDQHNFFKKIISFPHNNLTMKLPMSRYWQLDYYGFIVHPGQLHQPCKRKKISILQI